MYVLTLLVTVAFAQMQNSSQSTVWQAAPPIAWGQLTNGWQLALFAEKQSYFTDQPVNVALVGRNGNPLPLGVMVSKSHWYLADFEIRRLGDGKVLPQRLPKDMTERLQRSGLGSRETRVAPGGTARFGVIDLRMYDLAPGTYTVSAIFKFPNPDSKVLVPVRSNEITLSIVTR